jgi:hypothetical protein
MVHPTILFRKPAAGQAAKRSDGTIELKPVRAVGFFAKHRCFKTRSTVGFDRMDSTPPSTRWKSAMALSKVESSCHEPINASILNVRWKITRNSNSDVHKKRY